MDRRAFADELAALRRSAGLTLAQLAERTPGISPQSINSYERGRSIPADVAKVELLEMALGVIDGRLLRAAGFVAGDDLTVRVGILEQKMSDTLDRVERLEQHKLSEVRQARKQARKQGLSYRDSVT